MKATGVVRNVDQLGRVVIPKELRKTLGFEEGTPIEIFVNDDEVILRKYVKGCYCCGETENLVSELGLDLCPECLNLLNKAREVFKNCEDEESRGK
ncbi:AbrB/MazE/SpoVT family DNA-binding domain-containing protein [Clostridium sp. UBA4395]|uniref:AbrB/MazE/SpoVT family DNA-binding domain-containing protein n=1 Tax=Clostridium sp. UBA4395 TaxID=1946360 RepID=UPI0032162945